VHTNEPLSLIDFSCSASKASIEKESGSEDCCVDENCEEKTQPQISRVFTEKKEGEIRASRCNPWLDFRKGVKGPSHG
jgi:hypothetical protein